MLILDIRYGLALLAFRLCFEFHAYYGSQLGYVLMSTC
jgi:hypothetical protein